MRYLDTSLLVAALTNEAATGGVQTWLANPYRHRVRSQRLAENIAAERRDAVGEIALRRLTQSTAMPHKRRGPPGFQAPTAKRRTDFGKILVEGWGWRPTFS